MAWLHVQSYSVAGAHMDLRVALRSVLYQHRSTMSSPVRRIGGAFLLAVLMLGMASCANLGEVLGTRTVDIPLGEAGTAEVRSEEVTAHSASVRIDSIALPERLWVAEEMEIDSDDVSFSGRGGDATGSGVIECSMLIDGYPAALWSVAIERGSVEAVKPESTPVPGQSREARGGRSSEPRGRKPIPFPQLPKMRAAFTQLPASRRPKLADNLSFSLVGDEEIPNKEWGKVFRGINAGIEGREFEITLVASTEQPIRGTLTIETLGLTLFDSGQRLMGGMETGSE